MILIGWCFVAAAVLVVSLVVHLSTFLDFDPMTRWPGVMLIHLAIFPPFIAAVWYADRAGGKEKRGQDRVMQAAPRSLRILMGVFFVYGLVNFAIFMIMGEGGGPDERNGKYLLTSHGKVLRELTEAEYHRHRAYVVRGFSGHWMLFSSAALMLLVGTARLRGDAKREREALFESGLAEEPWAGAMNAGAWPTQDRHGVQAQTESTTARAALIALVVYVACVAMALSGKPALAAAAVPAVILAFALAIRRRAYPNRRFETGIGCLSVFPNALIASRMGYRAAEFLYVAVYAGLGPALTHRVGVAFPKDGPAQLTNGTPLDNRVWAALMLFVIFPLFAVGTVGLTYLAERVGKLVVAGRTPGKAISDQFT